MAQSNHTEKNPHRAPNSKIDQTVDVLYQKMGDRWFAFSLIDDEVFFGSITEDALLGAPSSNSLRET